MPIVGEWKEIIGRSNSFVHNEVQGSFQSLSMYERKTEEKEPHAPQIIAPAL